MTRTLPKSCNLVMQLWSGLYQGYYRESLNCSTETLDNQSQILSVQKSYKPKVTMDIGLQLAVLVLAV